MRKIIVLLLLIAVSSLIHFINLNFSSCITTISPGIIFNNTAEHVYKDRTTSQLGSGRIMKMEKSCTYNSIVFAFFYHGKVASAASIAREGGITKIGVVDYSSFNILGPLFYSNCIIVWGDIE
jgi:hypothetical protein